MAENNANDQGLVKRLEELLARHGDGDNPLDSVFTEEEIGSLKRVAARERAYEAIGNLGTSLKAFLTYVGFFIGIYLAIKAGIVEWVRSIVQ